MDEAPSGEQSSCHQSAPTTSHGTHSVADWGSTVVQMGCESIAARSSPEPQTCLMQMDYLQLNSTVEQRTAIYLRALLFHMIHNKY